MSAQSGKRSEVHPDRLTEKLAAFVAGARDRVLPDAVEHRARIVVLDTLGAILLGATLPAGRIVADTFGPRSAAGGATLIGHARKAEPGIAAYVNGVQAHADEIDDSHFASLTHPASTSLPGLLALAQVRGLSATEVFQGLSAAYDVQCRVSLAFDPTQLQDRGIMPLAVCGVYGSVASASFALGLDTEATTTAFGLAGLQSAGYWACATDGSHMSKAMMSAFPARNGVESAWLASAGFLGPTRVLEGRDGILGALSDGPRPEELTRELGERYEILGTSIKKHVSGGPIRGAVDGLFLILDKHAVRTEDIETIRVDLAGSAVAIVDNRDNPPINLQHVVAVGAIDRIVGLEQHAPERVNAADTLAMKARVQLQPDDEFEKVWPGERPARVTVTLTDGTVHTELVWNASGSPESPLTWSEVESKFFTITGRFLDQSVAREIAETVSTMHTADEFAALMSIVGSIRLEAGGHHS